VSERESERVRKREREGGREGRREMIPLISGEAESQYR
jgi:hypothetical protein